MSLTPFERQLGRCVQHIYAQLGSIHKEAHYQRALQIEFSQCGYDVTTEQHTPTMYIDGKIGARHNIYNDRLDMLIHHPLSNERYLLEIKHDNTPEKPENIAQVLRYYKNLQWTGTDITAMYIVGFPKSNNAKCKIKRVPADHSLLEPQLSEPKFIFV